MALGKRCSDCKRPEHWPYPCKREPDTVAPPVRETPCLCCKQRVGNPVFTVCDNCWEHYAPLPGCGCPDAQKGGGDAPRPRTVQPKSRASSEAVSSAGSIDCTQAVVDGEVQRWRQRAEAAERINQSQGKIGYRLELLAVVQQRDAAQAANAVLREQLQNEREAGLSAYEACGLRGAYWHVVETLGRRDAELESALAECRTRGIELEHARNAGPPGLWVCPRCAFVCMRSNLNARDGSITVNTDEPEPCPNDGEMLRRVTWREHAQDMTARATEQMERAVQAETERDTLRQQVATLTAAIRCTKHLAVPVQNRNEHTGGECGGCIAERVSALEEALREAEWNCAPGSGFCPLCHEPEDPMTYGNGKKVPGGHTRDCKLRALLTPKGETNG